MRIDLHFCRVAFRPRKGEKFDVPQRHQAVSVHDVLEMVHDIYSDDLFPASTPSHDLVLYELLPNGTVGLQLNPRGSSGIFQSYGKEDVKYLLSTTKVSEPASPLPSEPAKPVTPSQRAVCRGCGVPKPHKEFSYQQVKRGTFLCRPCAAEKESARAEAARVLQEDPEDPGTDSDWEESQGDGSGEDDGSSSPDDFACLRYWETEYDPEGDQQYELYPDQDSSQLLWQRFEWYCFDDLMECEHECSPADARPGSFEEEFLDMLSFQRERFLERRYPSVWTRWDQEALEGDHGAENMRIATVTLTKLGLE